LLYSPTLKTYSKPGENERDFRTRLQQAARERRDKEIDEINNRYEKKLSALEDRLRRYEAELSQQQVDAAGRRRETIVSLGESVLGIFLGRRSSRITSTSLSKKRQAAKAKIKMEKTKDDVQLLKTEIKQLEGELQKEVEVIKKNWEEVLEKFEEVKITPSRTDIQIDLVTLAWVPYWRLTYKGKDSAVRTELNAAY
ncbi:MAG: hypothetical protein QW739_03930, partial [Candidatus Odinarchaeota archaeon]